MKFRTIAVQIANEIKQIPNDTWHLFFFLLGWFADCRQLWQFWKENIPCFENIPFEQGEDVTIRCQWTPNIGSIHRMA